MDTKLKVLGVMTVSSGEFGAKHFLEVFEKSPAEAALAAGIFHRKEVPIGEVKAYLTGKVEIRPV